MATKAGFTPKTVLARQFRRAMTEPEVLPWSRLPLRYDSGLVFRCQFPAGAHILNFYCAKARLAIECDGAGHSDDEQARRDVIRDTWLMSKNIEVHRIPAFEIYRDADGAANGVWLLADKRRKTLKDKQKAPPPPR